MARGAAWESYTTFGELLRYLRQRARLTQDELGRAVGYSNPYVTRLEKNRRPADPSLVRARFVEALGLQNEPALADRLVELAAKTQARARAANEAPPSPEPQARAHTNLPAQLTHFVGREHEVRGVRQLLESHRLVTLTGAGGVGKTRLALEVGATLVIAQPPPVAPDGPLPADPVPQSTHGEPAEPSVLRRPSIVSQAQDQVPLHLHPFPHGVWLVELAPLIDPALVPRAVAEVFKLNDEPGHTLIEVLAMHLRDRRALLLLDNCEHLIGACAELTEALLSACPSLHVLATSREALRVPGEAAWRVPSLTTPDPRVPLSLAGALDYEAVQLFVEHTAMAQPGFELTPENLAAIVQMCHRLDGIPLAIEMAAAQTTAMTVQEIAANLDNLFAILTNGRRTVLPRHQTLRATIEWSYNLLPEPEQRLLTRLSVFTGGCTAEGAQRVCAEGLGIEDSPEGSHILPLLVQLVRKSLVVADTHREQTRYRLLETVRQYAAEKLHAHGETDILHERMAAYLVALERKWPLARATVTTSWLNRLEAELDNVRALMAWARARPDGETGLRLLVTLGLPFTWGYVTERLEWLQDTLARGSNAPADLRLSALGTQVGLLKFSGHNLTRWAAQVDESLALAEAVRDDAISIEPLFWAGMAAIDRQDHHQANSLFERVLHMARRLNNGILVANSIWGMGIVCLRSADADGAALRFNELLNVGQREHNWNAIFLALNGFTWLDASASKDICARQVSRLRAMGDPDYIAMALQAYTQPLLLIGDYAGAEAAASECLSLWRRLAIRWNASFGTAQAQLDLGQAAWLRGDVASADRWYRQSYEEYRQVGDAERIARLPVLSGIAQLAQGDTSNAASQFRYTLRIYQELNQPGGIGMTLAAFGALAEARGQLERAARLYGAAAVPRDMMSVSILWPASRVIYDHQIMAARTCYMKSHPPAWHAGECMTLDQAVEIALAE